MSSNATTLEVNPEAKVTLGKRISLMNVRWYRLVLAGLAILCGGVFMIWESIDTQRVENVSLVALEAGRMPTAKMVKVSGHLLKPESAWRSDGAIEHAFVPIVSVNWAPGDPVAAVARLSGHEYDELEEFAPIEGLVKTFRLDSEIKRLIEQVEPHVTLADSYILIEHGANPQMMRRFGVVGAGIGFVLLGIAVSILYSEGEPKVDEFAGDRALRAAVGPDNTRITAAAATRDMSGCDDAVRQWCQQRGFSGYQER